MQITSVSFLLFAAGVLLIHYALPKKIRWYFLLVASMGFYLMAGVKYLAFILLTALSTYLAGFFMDRNFSMQAAFLAANKQTLSREEKKAYKSKIKRKNLIITIICLVINFAVLGLCKFLIAEPFKTMVAGSMLSFLSLGLPLGISYYMFQTMGYVIDIYRATDKAERNPLKLLLFVSYFPQLIMGPISRHADLAPQLTAGKAFDGKEFSFGLQRMAWGFFKKMVIADRIAVAVSALGDFSGVGFFLRTVFYAVHIYADFTGGMDIALGLSQSLGIKLTENFVRPFFSKNIAEYWRRWHISLGEWMKSYIFYPISVSQPMLKLSKKARTSLGNFGKRLPVYVASIATWSITGIWHGITPNFIVWGMLNCFVIVVSEELNPLYEKFHNRLGWKEKKWYACFEILRMFVLMNLIRVVDLFPGGVGDYFRKMGSLFTTFNFSILWDGTMLNLGLSVLDYCILLGGIVLMFSMSLFQEKKGSFREFLWNKPVLRYILVFVLVVIVLLMGRYGFGYDASGFIYGQF